MDSGQPCNCDYESQRRLEYNRLVDEATLIANDDVLFEGEKQKYIEFLNSDFYKNEVTDGIISSITNNNGILYSMANTIRVNREFHKKHHRYMSVSEFLNNIF